MDFKTFFKKVVGTLENEVKTEVNRAKQEIKTGMNQTTGPTQQASQPQPAQPASAPERERTDAEWMTYFREILSQEFSQYAVRENVPVQELAGDISADFQLYPTRPQQAYKAEWGMPYTFVLYNAGTVRGVIVLGKYQKQSRMVKFLISRMYAKKMGVPFISFYMDAPNERGYVVERIRSYAR